MLQQYRACHVQTSRLVALPCTEDVCTCMCIQEIHCAPYLWARHITFVTMHRHESRGKRGSLGSCHDNCNVAHYNMSCPGSSPAIVAATSVPRALKCHAALHVVTVLNADTRS